MVLHLSARLWNKLRCSTMNLYGIRMNPMILVVLLASIMVCVKASPLPQSANAENKKPPSVPGAGVNTGFDEIVVESQLNVRNKQPEKRQSKQRMQLVIPHMIPKKFSESPNSKYVHTEDPADYMMATTEKSGKQATYEKPEKPKPKRRPSTTTTSTTATSATTEKDDDNDN